MAVSSERIVKMLDAILKKAKMSTELRHAVTEIKAAVIKGDYNHAADVSGVKSFIVGEGASEENRFREDTEYNEKVFGNSLYGLLDGLHFDLAMATKSMPRGMVMFSANGKVSERKQAKPTNSPTLKQMAKEMRAIQRRSRERAMNRYK